MDLSINALQERLGSEASSEDAEQAWERAEDWFNATDKQAVLAWYSDYYRSLAEEPMPINDEDGQLVGNWGEIVIFARAASLVDLSD